MIRELLECTHDEGLSAETVAKIRRHIHALFAFADEHDAVDTEVRAQKAIVAEGWPPHRGGQVV
jgi:hypothetical protein